jgi:CHAD domain-containing protein
VNTRLPAERKAGEAVRAALRLLAVRAERDLRRIADAPEERIHDLRTAMKRFRSLLGLARDSLPKRVRRAMRERVRVLKDGLAGSRDDAVIVKTVGAVLDASAMERLGLRPRHAGSAAAVPESLFDAAAELKLLTETLDLDGMKAGELMDGWRRTVRACGKARRKARESGDAHDFHRWRKRVKDLWYQSEALARRSRKAANAVKPAKALSDCLGLEHDLTMVLESVKGLTSKDRAALAARRDELRAAALEA